MLCLVKYDEGRFSSTVFTSNNKLSLELPTGRGCLLLLKCQVCVGGCCVLKFCKDYVRLVLNLLVLIRHPCVLIVSE